MIIEDLTRFPRVGASAEKDSPKLGLGDMLRRELVGKKFLSMEPHHERLRKRIVSKKGNINIGKTKVSQRWGFEAKCRRRV